MLTMYERLLEGKVINCSMAATESEVDERSIPRDISDLHAYLGDRMAFEGGPDVYIEYSKDKQGYIIVKEV